MEYKDYIEIFGNNAMEHYILDKLDNGATANQLNIIHLLLSKIGINDNADKVYCVSADDYMNMKGKKDNRYYYSKVLKEAVLWMDSKNEWIETETGLYRIKWFNEVMIEKGGDIWYKFDETIFPYIKRFYYSIYEKQ